MDREREGCIGVSDTDLMFGSGMRISDEVSHLGNSSSDEYQ